MLIFPENLFLKMINHVHSCSPAEACGLLAGLNGVVEEVLPVLNQLNSPKRFLMDPVGQLHAMQLIDDQQQDLLAIFHSHPQGPQHPSETDIREFLYPGVLSAIIFPQGDSWNMRVFQILADGYEEVEWNLSRLN